MRTPSLSFEMTPRARVVRPGKFALLPVTFAACLASCAGGGSSGSSILPTQANAANVSTTSASPIPPVQITMPSTRPSPAAGGDASPVITNPASTAPVPVTMTYAFGSHGTAAQRISRRRFIQDAAYTGYTSTAAPISVSLNVTPIGGSTSNYTGSCTASATGTTGTCTVTFTALPGPTVFAGSLTESGNTIASFSQTQIIAPGSANSLNFTANPVVNSVSVSLGSASVNGGTTSSVPIIITAYDANGYVIAGKQPYVDNAGNPVSFSLNVTNNQAGGRGTVGIRGPLRITAPGQASVSAQYDGNWLESASISVTSTSSLIPNPAPASLAVVPKVYNYTVGSTINGFALGPDGNFWLAESNGTIQLISMAGTIKTTYTPPSGPTNIFAGPDGNMWFPSTTQINSMSTAGILLNSYTLPGSIGGSTVVGSDGNFWSLANNTTVYKTTTNGITSQLPFPYLSGGGVLEGIARGSDGNIWLVDTFGQTGVYNLTPQGVFTLIGASGIQLRGITQGSDGNFWAPARFTSNVYRVTRIGTTTSFTTIGNPTGAITSGPAGNIWFGDSGNNIGRILVNCSTSCISEYAIGSTPTNMMMGSDGNIWLTYGTNKIGKFVY